MFRFFLKKNFADVWDNLFHLIVVNSVQIASTIVLALALLGISSIPLAQGIKAILYIFIVLLAASVLGTLVLAEGENVAKISRYEGASARRYFKNILPSIKDGVKFGLLIAFLFAVAFISIPFYLNMWLPADGKQTSLWWLWLILLALTFWFIVISFFALQWFIPIKMVLGNNFKKCLKKCYIVFFDNALFSIGVAFINSLNVAITIFTLGLIPGSSGMILTTVNAFRLRMYKYDWYEVNPGLTKEQRKDIPWDELLVNERKALGKRTWKSFLFPWRD